jgi:hypothetical protein
MEQLKQSLKNLHQHLNNTEQIDAELSELLLVLNEDIQQLLSKERLEEDALSHLGDRALGLSAEFAARNPYLEAGLRELGNILIRMGI